MEVIEVIENKKVYMELLLLADEQEDMIDKYITNGKMYVLDDNGVKGECIIIDAGNKILEIKNIAIRPDCQRKGSCDSIVSSSSPVRQSGERADGKCFKRYCRVLSASSAHVFPSGSRLVLSMRSEICVSISTPRLFKRLFSCAAH